MAEYLWSGHFLFDLLDMVIEVLRSTKYKTLPEHTGPEEAGAVLDAKTKIQHEIGTQKVDQLTSCSCWT